MSKYRSEVAGFTIREDYQTEPHDGHKSYIPGGPEVAEFSITTDYLMELPDAKPLSDEKRRRLIQEIAALAQ